MQMAGQYIHASVMAYIWMEHSVEPFIEISWGIVPVLQMALCTKHGWI